MKGRTYTPKETLILVERNGQPFGRAGLPRDTPTWLYVHLKHHNQQPKAQSHEHPKPPPMKRGQLHIGRRTEKDPKPRPMGRPT